MLSVLTHGLLGYKVLYVQKNHSHKRIRECVAKGGGTDHRVSGACSSFPNNLKNKH